MNKIFPVTSQHDSHVYVADYTQQTGSTRGVEISNSKFPDIEFCSFYNNRGISCFGVNFEKNKNIFMAGGHKVSQCECMLVSKKYSKKGWLCLIEMKYCQDKNTDNNAEEAYNRLLFSYDYLLSSKIIDPAKHRVYFNISIPDHSHLEPFLSFKFSQDDRLELKKEKKIIILDVNTIVILNEAYLQEAH